MIMPMSATATRKAYLATRVLDTPFWAIYNMLPVIMYKDLHASPLQIALLVSFKPLMALVSYFFSHWMTDKLLTHTIIVARISGLILFLLFPYITSIPLILVAYGLYMAMAVGTVPSWIELLKQNLGEIEQKKTFALGSSLGYLGAGILPFFFAYFLDHYQGSWKWLFQGAALIALVATLFVFKLESPKAKSNPPSAQKPWKESFYLLKNYPDFGFFQTAFMVFGMGLMILQPALPMYFVDELHLSYTELALALAVCKGVSYAIAAPFFASWLQKLGIFRFGSLIATVACFFPLFLILAKWNSLFVYTAYIIYGAMQSGSELAWNLSGSLFSKEKESQSFTRLNIITVGLRGAIAPGIGAVLLSFAGSFWVQSIGIAFFLMSVLLFSMKAVSQKDIVTD